ncbi:MAG: J domain-containing protein [Armatimonadota bacterium]
MPAKKTHYQILGVSRLSTADQIKRRYRFLARKYHPDVAEDKEAASRIFIEISDAYQTLSDPDKRIIYDASLDKDFLNYQSRVHTASRSGTSTQNQRTQYNTTYTRNDDIPTANPAEEVLKKVREAESAFIAHQFKVAISAAKQAIRLDRRNAKAHIILGDVYRIQGLDEQAVAMYTVALQLDPRNIDVQTKLDRLMRNQMDSYGYNTSDKPSVYLTIALVLGWILVFAALMYIKYVPGTPIPWLKDNLKFIDNWSSNLIISLFAIGILVGFLLSLHNKINPLDEELFFQGIKTPGAPAASYPIGLVLLIFNVINFYLAAAIYIVIGLAQDSISKSVFSALSAVVGCVVFCAILYPIGASQVLLFGGNVVFPGLLLGWMIGDMFRPAW